MLIEGEHSCVTPQTDRTEADFVEVAITKEICGTVICRVEQGARILLSQE
jgi:hypothetical protein